jgi:predicted nucleic acid-binding protein
MTSQPLRLEVLHVLQEKFKWTEERLETVFDLGWGPAVRVPTEIEIRACSDPDDDRVLECAVSGMVSVIVTGDHHTLVMQSFQGIGILTPNDFLLEIMKSDG